VFPLYFCTFFWYRRLQGNTFFFLTSPRPCVHSLGMSNFHERPGRSPRYAAYWGLVPLSLLPQRICPPQESHFSSVVGERPSGMSITSVKRKFSSRIPSLPRFPFLMSYSCFLSLIGCRGSRAFQGKMAFHVKPARWYGFFFVFKIQGDRTCPSPVCLVGGP